MNTLEKSKDQQMTEDYGDSIRQSLLDGETEAVRMNQSDADDDNENGTYWSQWLDEQLEIKIMGQYSLNDGEWAKTGIEVLVTYGGPNCWVKWNEGSAHVEIETYWGSSRHVTFTHAPLLAQELEQILENVA